jgi:pimeloyl-ACP methyl ester carboxylesterase
MRNKSLYLHMGPGMNAEPEKSVFSQENPHIVFWNQPAIQSGDSAFAELASQAKKQIETLAAANTESKKINLIAHCFGASLALECLKTHGDFIEECQFIAPTFCMNDFLLSLLQAMADAHHTDPALKLKIRHYLQKPYSPGLFWEGYDLVMQDPAFSRCYWISPEKQKFYMSHTQNLAFDEMTFKNVVSSFLKLKSESSPSPFLGKVGFFIGSTDPIMKNSQLINNVKSQFVNSYIRTFDNTGHFPHFESQLIFI